MGFVRCPYDIIDISIDNYRYSGSASIELEHLTFSVSSPQFKQTQPREKTMPRTASVPVRPVSEPERRVPVNTEDEYDELDAIFPPVPPSAYLLECPRCGCEYHWGVEQHLCL
jgi:hypothetical protein